MNTESGQYKKIDQKKASAHLELIKEREIQRVDMVAHSQGCVGAVLAALAHPDKVRNLVLVNPAAMIKNENLISLAKNFKANIDFAKSAVKSDPSLAEKHMRGAVERKANLLKLWNTLKSAHSLSQTQIIDSLSQLKEKGVKVVVIHDVNDKLFAMDKVQDNFLSLIKQMEEKGEQKEIVDGFISVNLSKQREAIKDEDGNIIRAAGTVQSGVENPTGHNDFYLQSEVYMPVVNSVLESLEHKE